MAEARAAMLSQHRKQGFRLGLRNHDDGYVSFTVRFPHPRTVQRGFFKMLFNLQRKFLYGLWPLSPRMATLITAAVCVAVLFADEHSWWRDGNLAHLMWRIDTILTFGWWQELCSNTIRAMYLAFIASAVIVMLLMMIHRYIFRLILSNHAWLYSSPLTPLTWKVKLWIWIVRRIRGKKPLLYSYQGSLPHLPVPKLKDTVSRYLESVKAVLGGAASQEYMTLHDLAENFMDEEGPRIQQYLRFRSLFKGNYVSDWWEKYVYLNNRSPLMINSNYYILGSVSPPTTSQTARAAVLVHLFARFKRLVDREQLEPLFIRDIAPTCMNQYRRLFSTTRIPDRDCDELSHLRVGHHVVVQRNGYFFKLPVVRWDGALYSASQLQEALARICVEADSRDFPDFHAGGRLGAFTATERTSWATCREKYFSDGLNRASLRTIERAAFFVSLDRAESLEQLWASHRRREMERKALENAEKMRQRRLSGPRAQRPHASGSGDGSAQACTKDADGENGASAARPEPSAVDILGLDDTDDRTPEEVMEALEWQMRGRALMHGDGSNRWFDKSISLVVFPNGQAGLNVEHTFADAPAVAHLWEFALTHEWHTQPYAHNQVTGIGGDCVQRAVDEETKRVDFKQMRRSPSVNNVMLYMKGIADDDDGADDTDTESDLHIGSKRGGGSAMALSKSAGTDTFEQDRTLADPSCCEPRSRSRRRAGSGPEPLRLRFSIPEEGQHAVKAAVAEAQEAIADLDLYVMRYDHYGKRLIKALHISPDAYIQMALQVANFRDTGRFALTYEASMTRLFVHGRTETVRPATVEAKAFVDAMGLASAPKPPPLTKAQREEREELLRAACLRHVQLYKDAMSGQGIDRHLFALLVVSKGMGVESEFLKQAMSLPWGLSSSQEPQRQQPKWWAGIPPAQMERMVSWGGGFGPVANDGYGVSYMVREDAIFFHISSQRHSKLTDSARFAQHLRRAFADIRDIFRGAR